MGTPLCDAYAYVYAEEGRQSQSDRRKRFIYVGESRNSPCYLLWNPETKQTVERYCNDVHFQYDVSARGGGIVTVEEKEKQKRALHEHAEDEGESGMTEIEAGHTEEQSELLLGEVVGAQGVDRQRAQRPSTVKTTVEDSDEATKDEQATRRREQRTMVTAENSTPTGVTLRG